MTPREIVAKWIETEWLSHDPAIRDAENAIVAGLVADIQQAITAAVEEERKDERKACAGIARKVRTGTTNEWVRRTSEDIEALILARSPKD